MKVLVPVLLIWLIIFSSPFPFASGFIADISDPARIPYFDDFPKLVLVPGESADFTFKIYNRYDATISSAVLRAEIYEYQTLEEKKSIENVEKAPLIVESKAVRYDYNIRAIQKGGFVSVKFKITTYRNTPEGSYVLRFNLTFTYENTTYTMLSRGYYSAEDWEYARKTGENYPGKINLDFLEQKYNSCAVLPDSQFSVKSPIPMWPFFLLVAIAMFFAILAIVFYLQEETHTFPKTSRYFKALQGKMRQLIYLRRKKS